MTKQERTDNFISENFDNENRIFSGLEMWQELDIELRQTLDYHKFRTGWKLSQISWEDALEAQDKYNDYLDNQ